MTAWTTHDFAEEAEAQATIVEAMAASTAMVATPHSGGGGKVKVGAFIGGAEISFMVPPHMVVAKTQELSRMREKIEGALPRESASSGGEARDSRGKGHAKGKENCFKGKSKGKDFMGKSKGKDSSDESSEGSANPPPHKRGKRDEPGNAAGEDSSDEPVMSAAEAAGGHKKDKKDKKDHKAKAKKDTVVDVATPMATGTWKSCQLRTPRRRRD